MRGGLAHTRRPGWPNSGGTHDRIRLRDGRMVIRSATVADREAILAVDVVACEEPLRARLIDRLLTSGGCLVAERDRSVLGYGGLEYRFFDNGFIPVLYVAEPERRRGVGRALMESLASRCETAKLFTSTNESNRPMQRLLASLGYARSGVIENLDPGDPELIYFLDLSRSGGLGATAPDTDPPARRGASR